MAFDIAGEFNKIMRVIRIASRPRQKEFWHMAKVTSLGIVLMGGMGLVISRLMHFI